MIKICYVGQFNRLSVGEPEIALCLEKSGHQIFRLEEKQTNLLEISQVIKNNNCNLLLYAKFRINNTPNEIREYLEKLTIPSCCWLFDLYWGM